MQILLIYILILMNLMCLRMAEKNNVIKEGKANVFLASDIFYNPVQEFNRDMSIVALTVFAEESKDYGFRKSVKRRHNDGESDDSSVIPDEQKLDGITVVEALSATGLRSIRYALEVPNIAKIYANDLSIRAVEAMQKNIKDNGVEHIIDPTNHDAIWLLQKLKFENKAVHAIDLDPYGCPTRFLNAAINCITDGGILMITCTDMAVMAGNTPETCYAKYGCISLRSPACHEMALRIALQCVASHCGQVGRYIVPLLSFSADFYIRIIVRVFCSQKTAKEIASNISLVYKCIGCETMTLHPMCKMFERPDGNTRFNLPEAPPVSPECAHCGGKHRVGGPIWSGKLYDEEFVDKMLKVAQRGELPTHKRVVGMLSLIKEELNDVPLYYTVDSLCRKLHCVSIPAVDFRSALLNAGYKVSQSHCKTNSIKTNAPANFIWDVLRHWVKKNPVSKKRLEHDQVASNILSKEPEFEVNFKYCKNAVPLSVSHGLLRYQQNPMPYWGPGGRSKSGFLTTDGGNDKKIRNQNKKQRFKNSSRENDIEEVAGNGNETNITTDIHLNQNT